MSNLVQIQNSNNLSAKEWPRERIDLIKRTFCKGATDDELHLFIGTCHKLGLSPEARQVFAVKRWDNNEKREVMSIQVSVDGLRLAAERTGRYDGQTPAEWCGKDGVWRDVWFTNEYPMAARVGVYIKGISKPLYATAHWDEYVQMNKKEGKPTSMWTKMPRLMLAKCAESLALRKAFPADFSNIYTNEEMQQSANGKPSNPNISAALDKLIVAFDALHEKKTGKKNVNIRYFIEDLCGGKNLDQIDETDIQALRMIYSDIMADKQTFENLAEALYPNKSALEIDAELEDAIESASDKELDNLGL